MVRLFQSGLSLQVALKGNAEELYQALLPLPVLRTPLYIIKLNFVHTRNFQVTYT